MLEKITDLPRICSQSPYWSSTYLQTDSSIFVGVNEDSETSAITRFDVNQYLQLSSERAGKLLKYSLLTYYLFTLNSLIPSQPILMIIIIALFR